MRTECAITSTSVAVNLSRRTTDIRAREWDRLSFSLSASLAKRFVAAPRRVQSHSGPRIGPGELRSIRADE